MGDLLTPVWIYLAARGVSAAVIGASALASYGISRSTHDIDLLVMDRDVLRADFWDHLGQASVEVRRADAADPLAGVVRCSRPDARPVDIVVGRHRWMQDALGRAEGGDAANPPVIARADWVCLKLFAGGMQDLSDVAHLRAVVGPELDADVHDRLAGLPDELARQWARVIAWNT